MLYNLVRGPQVCQLFSCYVSPSINKVLTYLLTLSALVKSAIQVVNITERQMSFYPEVKTTYKVAGDMSAKGGMDEV